MPDQQLVYCYVAGDLIVHQGDRSGNRTGQREGWPYFFDADGTLVKCPRCGGRHPGLTIYTFRRPVTHPAGGIPVFNGWTVCPKTLEPILLLPGDGPRRSRRRVARAVREALADDGRRLLR